MGKVDVKSSNGSVLLALLLRDHEGAPSLNQSHNLTRAHALARRDHFQHDREQMNNLLGYHDTVEELGSLVQQAQLRAGAKTKRGSSNCAESRTQLLSCAVEKFLRDKPSVQTMANNVGQESVPR